MTSSIRPSSLAALRRAALALMLCGAAACQAQGNPAADTLTPEQMVEKLRQPAPPAADGSRPRTRSLRNLSVEAVPEQDQPRAALSFQIQFDFNSAQVKPESQKALSNLAQAMLSPELANAKFGIEGHTDAKGRAEYNLQLSQQRADAVKSILVQQGVPTTRLAAAGKGATQLADAAHPLAPENRRVRVVNLESN